MRHFKLTLSYDGTNYAGWQYQPDRNTIQAELERAIEKVTGQGGRTIASGRTDAGVHAIGQVVSFSRDTHLSADALARAINVNLPRDIVVIDVSDASDGFPAIRDAVRKRYRYVVQDGKLSDVLARRFAWHVPHDLDVHAMRQAAEHLVGEHDFSSFEASGAPRTSSVRTIYELSVRRRETEHRSQITFDVEANGFLYNMVRNMVGTLVAVGRGTRSPDWIVELLAIGDRRLAGMTAPPQGLLLVRVDYDP